MSCLSPHPPHGGHAHTYPHQLRHLATTHDCPQHGAVHLATETTKKKITDLSELLSTMNNYEVTLLQQLCDFIHYIYDGI